MAAETTTGTISRWDTTTGAIVGGLTLGWVLGLAGGIAGPGTAQEALWAVSSAGIMAAAVVLAVRHASTDVPLAAGFVLLAIGEAVIHTGGPGAVDPAASATYGYVPALLLIAASRWAPTWARVTTVGAAVAFGVYAAQYLAGQAPPIEGAAMSAGYGLLSLSIIGWTLRVVRESQPH